MAGQVVLETLQHQRTAVHGLFCLDFIQGQPNGAVNIAVQFLMRIMLGHLAAKTIADIGFVFAWVDPAIDANQGFGFKLPGGFFPGFTNGRLDQAFVGFEVAGGLV